MRLSNSDPYQMHLYSRHCRTKPGARSNSERFSPALALTFLPGLSTVPRAEAVMFFTCRSSMTIRLWFLANRVVAL